MTNQSATEPSSSSRRAWTLGRVLARLAVVVMVGMWGYVLYLAIGPGRQPPPDRLDDPTFAAEAQAICTAALDDVARLPAAIAAESATERADIVARANARFDTMLDDIGRRVPAGDDGDIVEQWLADWRTYLEDRADFVEALRTEPEAQLLVTAKDREQITEYIDAFSADNRMTACATPIDV